MQTSENKPNIIFIMADDMGYGDVGCYNSECKIPTPNMDKLANEGMRLTDMHTPSAVCSPTRYGVLTGRYAWRTRLKKGVLLGYDCPLIEEDRMNLASILKEQSYNTAAIGKWHLGLGWYHKDKGYGFRPDKDNRLDVGIDFTHEIKGGPEALGFDYFYGISASMNMAPFTFIENNKSVGIPNEYKKEDDPDGNDAGLRVCGYRNKDVDTTFTEKAKTYIKNHSQQDKPFFLYMTPSTPHAPNLASNVPDFAKGKSKAGVRGDQVYLMDWIVGEIMSTVKECNIEHNTIIIITSDNGALPGDRTGGQTYDTYDHKSCGDYRGYKAHSWEGGHRVPFIIKWENNIRESSVCDKPACLVDMMSTFRAIFDLNESKCTNYTGTDSYNLLPYFLEDKNVQERPYIIHHSGRGTFGIRKGEWKYIENDLGSGGWPPPKGNGPIGGSAGQLYHILDDPCETDNLFSIKPDIVKELSFELDSIKTSDYGF